MTDLSTIIGLLHTHGLVVLGTLDRRDAGGDVFLRNQRSTGQIVLVGNAGSSIWPEFTGSREYSDNLPHPMDRWSKRIGTEIAAKLDAGVVFPFEGPPYPPVLDWAGKAGCAFPSPISMFIHGEYGLWHAHRFALQLPEPLSGFHPVSQAASPCLSCAAQPCLSACPVDAFVVGRYRVDDCVAYLAGDENSACRQSGCSARRSCPVGVEFHYQSGHARFHMNAFLDAQK
jgi:hypothetical protein